MAGQLLEHPGQNPEPLVLKPDRAAIWHGRPSDVCSMGPPGDQTIDEMFVIIPASIGHTPGPVAV